MYKQAIVNNLIKIAMYKLAMSAVDFQSAVYGNQGITEHKRNQLLRAFNSPFSKQKAIDEVKKWVTQMTPPTPKNPKMYAGSGGLPIAPGTAKPNAQSYGTYNDGQYSYPIYSGQKY